VKNDLLSIEQVLNSVVPCQQVSNGRTFHRVHNGSCDWLGLSLGLKKFPKFIRIRFQHQSLELIGTSLLSLAEAKGGNGKAV
jgi:hypothetical protein